MKKLYKLLSIILLLPLALIFSCQDDDHELGRMLTPSEISYRVEQDLEADPGGNTVILINETPGTVPVWDYGTGRSNRMTDTIRFAFKGEYQIKLSVLTAGGVVPMDPVTVQVTEDNLMYVNDPLWTALSGGVGEEKTWVLDLDAEGVSKYFDGPLYFYGTDNGWEESCLVEEGDCWNWKPEWAGNTWLMPAGDYGTLTFSLDGGPYVTANHPMNPARGEESGTYFLDADGKVLSLTDATILHDEGREGCVADWGQARLFSLTENTMQLGILRKDECEGAAMLVYNFISKEYADNWTPEEPGGDPNFDHGNQSELLAVDRADTKTWGLDTEVPFNWTDLEGNFLNEWNSRADIMASGWAPYGDADVENIDNASISFSEDGTVVVKQDDGTTQEGTYSIDEETNIVTFEGVQPVIPIAGWVSTTTTEENQWKIVKLERNAMDKVTGIWFGKRDPEKSEYMAFHFKLKTGNTTAELTPEQEIMKMLAGTDAQAWQLDEEVPFNWTSMDGTFLNEWSARSDYPDWAAYDDTHVDAMNDASVQFFSDGKVVVTQDDGTSAKGAFAIDGANKTITFDGVTPSIPVGGWMVAGTSEENTWKIVKTERNENRVVTGIWFGKPNPDKPEEEYIVFHFVPE